MSDYGINRQGQRVRCIVPEWRIACTAVRKSPKFGAEYTVASFEDALLNGKSIPGIHLREIVNGRCLCLAGSVPSWPLAGFRPVVGDESKTDISALIEAAREVTIDPKPRPAKTAEEEVRAAFHRLFRTPWPKVLIFGGRVRK